MSIFDGGHGFTTGPRSLRRRERAESDSQPFGATYLASDIPTLEDAADALSRAGELRHAVALWAIALRIREAVRHV
jgi:hypothetical protein